MDLEGFKLTIKNDRPPVGVRESLAAMWYDAKGDWERAHDIAQELDTSEGSWIHAYLHRKEGDQGNAAYWYRKAGKPFPSGLTLEEEWEAMTRYFLSKAP